MTQNESSDYEQDLRERKRRRFSVIVLVIALLLSLAPISSVASCDQNSKKEVLLKQLNPAIVYACVYSDEHELGVWFVTQQSPAEVEAWFQSYTEQILQSYYGSDIMLSVNTSASLVEISAISKKAASLSENELAAICIGGFIDPTSRDLYDNTNKLLRSSLAQVDFQISEKAAGEYSVVKMVPIWQAFNAIPGQRKLVIFPDLHTELIKEFTQSLPSASRS
jgi:hypothetical protein